MSLLSGRVALVNGVAAKLGTGVLNKPILVKAAEGNTVSVFIGNNGSDTVTSGTGMELGAGDYTGFDMVGKLDGIYVIAYAAGQYVSWHVTEA